MGKASTQAQEYSKNIKEGTGSAQVYADKQKTLQQSIQNTGTASRVAAVGVKALSIAGNMLAGMAISFAISKVIEGINYLITASERAIEKTKELQQEISQISSDYQSERQTLEGLREEYDALTSKIGENGAEASLSADEYERYRDITSEILGITPKLITGWDEEGRAISNKNGLLQQSIDLLDEEYQKSLRNSTTKSKNEEIAAGIIEQKKDFDNSGDTKTVSGTRYDLVRKDLGNYINEAVANKKISYTYESTGIIGTDDTDAAYAINEFVYGDNLYKATELNTAYGWLGSLQERITSSKENFEKFANSLSNEDNPIYQWFTDEQIDELIRDADEYFQELARIEGEEQQYFQQYKDQLNLNAQAVGDAYSGLDGQTKAGITQMIDSFDYNDMTKEKFSDMATDLKDFVGKLSTDDVLLSYFNNLFKPIGEDESIEDYETRVKTGIDEITSYCESNYPAIKLSFGDIESDVEDLKLKYNTAISKFVGDANDVDLTQFFKDNSINDESEIDYWNKVTDGAKTASEAVEMYNKVKSETFNNETDIFSIETYQDQIDNIQSSISTLRSALDSLNLGTLDEESVLDLMQEFPDLIPYIDLTADGFGNLSEGLSALIEQQPESFINSLETLKNSLNTEEERAQIDELINSLQLLSSYGDTGMEAYAASIGNTWNDTANVIEGVTTQFENLAKVQEAVSNGLTMSATAAAELAKMYPEILNQAEFSADGQITLNEDVVKNILAGDQSIINSQIEKLEADKAELTAKKELAIAELEIVNQVGTAKGQIDEETAKHKIELLNQELENEVEKDNQTAEAYAQTAETIAQNAENLDDYTGDVAMDMAQNMLNAAISMANSMKENSENSQSSLSGLAKKASDVGSAIANAAKGIPTDNTDSIYVGKSGTGSTAISKVKTVGNFSPTTNAYINGTLSFDEYKNALSVDISSYENAISNIDSQIEILKNLQSTFEDTVNSANGGIGGKSGASSAQDEYEELFDFFERRVSVLSDALSLLESNLENVTGSFAKNQLLDAEVNLNAEKINNYTDALSMYTQKANEALANIPADIAQKIRDGAVDLTTFIGDGNEEVVAAVKEYEEWADKVSDCKQELAELKETIRQLELEKFNNIIDDFTNQFDIREDANSLIDKQIALFEEAGQLIGESFYTAQIDQAQKQLAILEEEKTKLAEQMTSSLSSGRIEQGTDEWLEMVNALSDVDSSILDCKTSIEEFDNAILELHTEIFDRIQEQFSNLDSEIENLIGLFDSFDVSDDKGNWTKEGLAQLGLLTQQYELAQYQIQQYNNEIDELNKQYMNGRYSATEYADRLAELTSAQWDAVNSSESIKDAILDLNETRIDAEIEGIEKEIDAYKELIDAQIDALQAAKDLHDYEQSIAEKTKTVTELERQIAAMQNDDTAATVAKRKKLEEQLADARKDLESAEYDHSIETQEDALNKQYEEFEKEKNDEIESLRASLEQREFLIAQSFENVKANANLVGQEIAYIAQQHGITVSNALISSWQSGELAIASYGAVLTAGTSAFIANVIGVENVVWNLQSQANYTAESLAWMFAARADNLINELTASYYSEANLNSMTQALQDSLVNTLERGYNVSSIVSSLNSITNAANAAANAIRSVGTGNTSTTPNAPSATTSSSRLAYNSVDSSTGETMYKDKKTGMLETADYWKTYGKKYGILDSELSKLPKYISGTRHSKGNLIITDENGYELKLPKLNNGNYTIANEGSQILTRAQTDNIFDWSKFKPADLIRFHIPNPLIPLTLPDMQSRTISNPSLNIENLVTVNGNIDDTNINRMEKVAQKAVTKAFKDFSYECKKKGAW